MTYASLITKHYTEIKAIVGSKAFRFHLDDRDLLSLVNERMSVGLHNNNLQFETLAHFWGHIHKTVYTCAIDLKRQDRYNFVELDYCNSKVDGDVDSAIEAKELINDVRSLFKKDSYRQVFDEVLIHGEKYDDTAVKLGMSLGTVKNLIFNIRSKANKHFLKSYQS